MAAPTPAPGGEPQNQRLSVIRDFTAAAKSHGERAVSGLKRRLDDASTAELQASKRAREGADTELRRLQASIAATTSQVLQATISNLQKEITKVGSELGELKVSVILKTKSQIRSILRYQTTSCTTGTAMNSIVAP